eukprot:8647062-Pyramimonas_sp.AAC.1
MNENPSAFQNPRVNIVQHFLERDGRDACEPCHWGLRVLGPSVELHMGSRTAREVCLNGWQ